MVFYNKTSDTNERSNSKFFIKRFIRGGAFSRSKRFAYSDTKKKDTVPGPGYYLGTEISRNEPLCRSFTKEKRELHYNSTTTPGPGAYMPNIYIKKSPISMGKVLGKFILGQTEVISHETNNTWTQ